MIELCKRPGRDSQRRDEKGCRFVAGCIPYRYTKTGDPCDGESKEIEVLMVTPHRGDGLMFPKGAWENNESDEEAACREAYEEAGVKGVIKDFLGSWKFTSRRHRDEHSPEGFRKGHMFALLVTEELDPWPEKDDRQRRWVTLAAAKGLLRHGWMEKALEKCEKILVPASPLSESVDGSLAVVG